MKELMKRYRLFLGMFILWIFVIIFNQEIGMKAIATAAFGFKEMIMIVPVVFILLGLLDVWVPKEIMIKHMGEASGLKGVVLAFMMGSFAAGPLYAAFPIALVLMKKEAKFSNILIFIGAWSTTKVTTLLFEISALGRAFTFTRLAINIPGVIVMSYLLDYFVVSKEKENIYKNIKD